MTESIAEPVSVISLSKVKPKEITPLKVKWKQHTYTVSKVSLHYKKYTGDVLYHYFSVMAGTLYLRLSLNTHNLIWTLEEISDGIGA